MNFLLNYKQSKNLKLQSVLADAQSDSIDCFLVALGIVYHQVTGPYWMLVRSNTHYLNFFKYVGKMHTKFLECSQDSSSLLNKTPPPLFEEFILPVDDCMTQALYSLSDEQSVKVQAILRELFSDMSAVTERQLSDFLPGGRYHDVQSPEVRSRMQHSKLTNLIGEQCFGDLDFSIFKRRNASLHHHGTVNMIKRNHTMSAWFSKKTSEEQSRLLSDSAVKAPELRSSNQGKAALVTQQHRQRLEENKLEIEQKLQETLEMKRKIVAGVKQHGGPCLVPEDVDAILIRLEKAKSRDRLDAIKLELQYHKRVMGMKSPKLNVTGKLDQLVMNLKDFLSETAVTGLSESFNPDGDNNDSVDESFLITGDDDNADSGNPNDNLDQQPAKMRKLNSFTFSQQGEWVAVFYDEEFYIGQVVNIANDQQADVQFLERCSLSNAKFRWPRKDDIDTVDAKYVFSSNFEVTTSNGRVWTVMDVGLIDELYKIYKRQYC